MATHKNRSQIDRRTFVKTATASAIAVPYFVQASALGKNAPSNRITLGCIGVGNQGFPVMQRFLSQPDCQVLAVCDVNRGSDGYKDPGQIRGREPAQEEVQRHYSSTSSCRAYHDFREVLQRDDINAVMIATPDHWHAPMTIAACEAGKDVYCEKPLGLTIGQQQAMIKAVRQHDRILQTGSHERSNPIVKRACELVRGGYIGEVKRVVAHVGRHNKVGPGPGWKPMPVPEGFDYAMWLGPAPDAPYHQDRCLYRFRFNYDYAGGQVANFGAHSLDIAQWGLGTDLTGPTVVECRYAEFLPAGSLFNAATYTHFRCRYKNGVELECRTAEPAVRCIFEGSDGYVRVDNSGKNFVCIPHSLKDKIAVLNADSYYSGEDHVRNFLDCVKTRDEPNAPVEIGHRSATICHLGNIACRLGGKFKWAPEIEKFEGSRQSEGNAMLDVPQRTDWQT